MSSLRPVGRSAATLDKDRKSLCCFTFADGRQCRTPRSPHHPHFCSDHARKDSQARAADKLASDLSYFFSGQYLSACDLSAVLGRLLPAVVRGDIKLPSTRTATGSGSSTSLTTGPIAAHSPAQNEHRIRSACNGWSSDRGTIPLLTPLDATLIEMPASVDSKPLTQNLSPLDATLTENQGEGGSAVKYPSARPSFRFGSNVFQHSKMNS